jgi:NAD-dependent deacetylase
MLSLLKKIKSAKSIVFFTGAGISAESGIPTFRGKDGLWKKIKPEELANFDSFLKNPELVWEWYNHRKKIIHEASPNKGHYAIAEFQNIVPEVSVITQNIDNLHRRAGSKILYELHGNIERNYCIKCKTYYNGELDFSNEIPSCKCGGLIRPDVVWFGEFLPEDQFIASEKAAQNCDIFFSVGTSAVVYPAAGLILTAKRSGAFLAEINIEETEISRLSDISFFKPSGQVLPEIVNELKS